ncbi:AAA domain-containing protein, putative AbiEii toxin, Type IV TA system [Arachidicoccus rhizosphaerae]|uniref:AAA domain-containing protein, putative AbiEii toxin, Type IV TA system n=1 Tax=Arachidicoccus rhizosphaerae TaxID=551991 RepID=A0A1H4AJM8_9BACT|nr:AAA family ATPase [Arachidicoccus rhizosphaerae]SEA36007.1 AAA domain-containing protein, putative AbiEii toxin, Type IV TA system [Arachidicoccus rhizosphaerae]
MLVKLLIENVFSFGIQKEFVMVSGREKSLENGQFYNVNGVCLNKIAGVYGLNGSGKSDFIKCLDYLKKIVTGEILPDAYKNSVFQSQDFQRQLFIIVFIQNGTWFRYNLEIFNHKIRREALMLVGPEHEEYVMLFERTFDGNSSKLFLNKDLRTNWNCKDGFFEGLIQEDCPILKLLSNNCNEQSIDILNAYLWFKNTLVVITDEEDSSLNMVKEIDLNHNFKNFVERMMNSIDLNFISLKLNNKDIHDYFLSTEAVNLEDMKRRISLSKEKELTYATHIGEILMVKMDDRYLVKELLIERMINDIKSTSSYVEASCVTKRIFSLACVFYDVLFNNKVVFVDDLGCCIDSLLIRRLMEKFVNLKTDLGQLIFTDVKPMLLDLDILSQDEMWFVEKDNNGCTDLFPLNCY